MRRLFGSRVMLRFAEMSAEEREEVVKKVREKIGIEDGGEADSDEEESVEDVTSEDPGEEGGDVEGSGDDDGDDDGEEGPEGDEDSEGGEDSDDEDSDGEDEGDSDLAEVVEALQREIEEVKADGLVTQGEVMELLNGLIAMVSKVTDAAPPASDAKTAAISQIVDRAIIEAVLKDKDLMQDTGGSSKGRLREPSEKPSREDRKKRYRTRRKTKDERDPDVDEDPDEPRSRRSRDDDYPSRVRRALHRILEDEHGVSEKDFRRQRIIAEHLDEFCGLPGFVETCAGFEERGGRPIFCAEHLFGVFADDGR